MQIDIHSCTIFSGRRISERGIDILNIDGRTVLAVDRNVG